MLGVPLFTVGSIDILIVLLSTAGVSDILSVPLFTVGTTYILSVPLFTVGATDIMSVPMFTGRDENVLKRRSPQVLITCFNDDYSDKYERPFCDSIHSSQESVVSDASSLTVPIPDTLQTRAAYRVDNMVKYSSGSDNQTDEEEDLRPPPSAFRRRRGAMTSETLRTTLEVQDTLDEESENGPQYGLESRRPSANIVSLPSLQISPGDLHVVHGVSLAGLETGTSHLLANYLQVKADLGESYPSLNNSD
uniref:Uncharacterized protein LOC102807906 n=1 Tax=Saccoglossus kowalevskii TaxID=10224 RepID=A0ABM0MAN1_SACKO